MRKKSFKILASSGNLTWAAGLTGEYATSVLKTSCLATNETLKILCLNGLGKKDPPSGLKRSKCTLGPIGLKLEKASV